MFIYKADYKKMKDQLDYLKIRQDEFKTTEKILYSDNNDLKQETADLRAECTKTRDMVRKAIRDIDKYDYRTMNVYTFLRDIKEELSTALERH